MSSSVFNVFSEPQFVEETIEFHTAVGAAGIFCKTKVSCSFVAPVLQFSDYDISFRVEMVRTA